MIAGLVIAGYVALGTAVALASLAVDAGATGGSARVPALGALLAFAGSIALGGFALLALRAAGESAIASGIELIIASVAGAAPASLLLALVIDGWLAFVVRKPPMRPALSMELFNARLQGMRVLAGCVVVAASVASAILATGLVFSAGLFVVLVPVPLLLLLIATASLLGVVRPLVRDAGSPYRGRVLGVMAIVTAANVATALAAGMGLLLMSR